MDCDTAATTLWALGYPPTPGAIGRPVLEAFDPETIAALKDLNPGDNNAFLKEIVVVGSNKHEIVEVKQIPFTNDEEFAKNADALA